VDAASWAAIVGPITILLGGLGGYWLAGRNDDARDRRTVAREESARRAALADRLEEDRHAFQRDTLLELQDELQRLARATTGSSCETREPSKKAAGFISYPKGSATKNFRSSQLFAVSGCVC